MKIEELLDSATHQRARAGVSAVALNFVAFVEEPQLRSWVASQTDELAQRHACRTIVLDACASENLSGITTRCALMGGETECEQLCVGVSGVDAPALRSVVRELLDSHVETVLLWAGSRLRDVRLRALSSLCEALVVDSECRDGEESLRELTAIADETLEHLLRDMAYLRLEGWQDLIALFFDEPDMAEELGTISRVRVCTGSVPEALYFVAWLASRLDWQACGKNAFCNPKGEPVAVEIQRREAPGLVSVTLDSANCSFFAGVDDDTPELACLRVTGRKQRDKRCAPLRQESAAAIVRRSVPGRARDDVFLETFRMLRKLLIDA